MKACVSGLCPSAVSVLTPQSAQYIVTGVSGVISPEPGQCVVSPGPGDIRDTHLWSLSASDQDGAAMSDK